MKGWLEGLAARRVGKIEVDVDGLVQVERIWWANSQRDRSRLLVVGRMCVGLGSKEIGGVAALVG